MKSAISLTIGMVLCVCGLGAASAAQQPMDPVIVAIDAAIASLRQQPNQFTLTVNVTGLAVTSSGAGTGMKVEVTGGGPGSQTTGLNVTATNQQQMNIAQSTADQALKQQAEKAIALLTEMKSLLQAPKVNKSSIMSRLTEFGKTYVAPVLKSVIEALIKKKLGL